MDDLRVGRVFRGVRRRRRFTQAALAELAGVARSVVSEIECGRLGALRLTAVRKVGQALEIKVIVEPSWRGGQLERLVDSRHAAIVECVVALLTSYGWIVHLEYTFNQYGERGSVDVLAWHPPTGALLIVEVKTELDGIGNALSVLDRKARLVPKLVVRDKGWRPRTVGVILVLPEGSTGRSAIGRYKASFAAALPAGNRRVRQWLAAPGQSELRGIWFLRDVAPGSVMESRQTPRRVRNRKQAPESAAKASNGPVAGRATAILPSSDSKLRTDFHNADYSVKS